MLAELISSADAISKVNNLTSETNSEHYKLETEATTPEEWWNNSNGNQRCGMGGICVDYGYMTPNCGWWNDEKTWNEIGKTQQRRVKFAFEKRNDKHMILNFHCLAHSYRR